MKLEELEKRLELDYDPNIQTAIIIQSLMIEENLTQNELAKKLGTKQSAISRACSANYTASLTWLNKLARSCGRKIEITLVPRER